MPTLQGSTYANFVISLGAPAPARIVVGWRTEDGTAAAGVDYAAASGRVTFAAGETTKNVSVLVYGQTAPATTKSFFLRLDPPLGVIIRNSTIECVIHPDVAAGTTLNLAGWAIGHGAPEANTGLVGQLYLDADSGLVYGPKTAAGWGDVIFTINAPPGFVGIPGPQGVPGPVGPQGSVGPSGAVGPQGPVGDQGPAGPVGPVGPIGSQGEQGPQGIQGLKGDTGATGSTGPKGDTGATGAEGIQGPPGPQGTTGPQGAAGIAGTDGKTVRYGSGAPAAGLGADGDFYIDTAATKVYGPKVAGAWPAGASMIGPMGPQGTAGVAGPAGAQGPQGPQGATGQQGQQGQQGPQGAQGAQGQTGATGPAGAAGTQWFGWWLNAGETPPAANGSNGDWFFNTRNGDVYGPKQNGSWGSVTINLTGPQGATGATGATGPQGATGATGATGPQGARNRLRNPRFVVNQRAASGTVTLTAGQYGHDGVKGGASGATYTFATSGCDVQITVTAGSIIMPIESRFIEGGQYTLSQAGSAAARIWQGTGTNGSGSYFSCPITVSGLTANTQTNIEFSAGTILRPQFEAESFATAFSRDRPDLEISFCQRYFFTSYNDGVQPGTAAWSPYEITLPVNIATNVWYNFPFILPVRMRATPAFAIYDQSGNINQATVHGQGNVPCVPADLYQTGFGAIQNKSANTWAAGSSVKFGFVASAEI